MEHRGSRGDRLIQQIDLNQPQPADVVANGGAVNISRPYLGYAGITMRQTTAYSRYNGLLTQFRHDGGGFVPRSTAVAVDERPPMATVPEYRSSWAGTAG